MKAKLDGSTCATRYPREPDGKPRKTKSCVGFRTPTSVAAPASVCSGTSRENNGQGNTGHRMRRTRQLRRTDVPHPNPLPTNGRGNQIASVALFCISRIPALADVEPLPRSLRSSLTRPLLGQVEVNANPDSHSRFPNPFDPRLAPDRCIISLRNDELRKLPLSNSPRAKWRSRHFALEWRIDTGCRGQPLPPAAQAWLRLLTSLL